MKSVRAPHVRDRSHRSRVLRSVLLSVLLAVLGALPPALHAQASLPEQGTTATGLLLRQMDGVKRLLMIAAHPDDEDTALLTAAARGLGARTAYLSLTRGEGGQNLIGPELDEGLGLIRTGELMAARELDGAEQYFSRAFDFGFSKRVEESLEHWPMEELLWDAVWLIRRLRPQVVVSVFSGTPRDGHGHHQAAGIVAGEAFRIAGDSTRFPEQLRMGVAPWQPSKLYRLHRFDPEMATLRVPTGTLDPLLGRSHFQVAMESRSQHRSQDMGAAQPLGPRSSALRLEATTLDLDPDGDEGLFAGVDTTLLGLLPRPEEEPEVQPLWTHLATYGDAVQAAVGNLHAMDPSRAAPHLARALRELRLGERFLGIGEAYSAELLDEVDRRLELSQRALLASAGVVVDVRASRELLVPGESLEVVVELWNGGPFQIDGAVPSLFVPPDWIRAEEPTVARSVAPGETVQWSFSLELPRTTALSRPYFLAAPREGSLYEWPPDPEMLGRAGNPPLVSGGAEFQLQLRLPGQTGAPPPWERTRVQGVREARYVGVDKAEGEFRRPLAVVPALSLTPEVRSMAWPLGSDEPRTVTVRVRHLGETPLRGVIGLEVPKGWAVEPRDHPLEFAGGAVGDEAAGAGGVERSFIFRVWPGGPEGVAGAEIHAQAEREAGVQADVDAEAGTDSGAGARAGGGPEAGTYSFQAVARTQGGRVFREGVALIDYPHIDPVPLFYPSEIQVSVFPVTVADRRVGYIMGSGDDGARALSQMGMEVELLSPEMVRAGEFQRFDVLVLGVRTYEVRPDVVAANEAILDFARRGGTVVVQYNKYEYPDGGFAPYRVAMSRPHDRITDPEAAITFLEPDHPVVNWPNRIGSADFDGWVQERGLYFLSEWAPPFQPILAMADPGEPPKRGGLVVAPVGGGLYIYTGLALFRQLPAGSPGAHRLLANLVAAQGSAATTQRP